MEIVSLATEMQSIEDYLMYSTSTATSTADVAQNVPADNSKPTIFGTILSYFQNLGIEIQSGFTRITKLFVGEVHIEGNVCVDDTCITKEQFKEMILRSGVGAVQMSQPADNSSSGSSGSSSSDPAGDSPSTSSGQGGQTASTTPASQPANTTLDTVTSAPQSAAPASGQPASGSETGAASAETSPQPTASASDSSSPNI
jgi:hypothetical protein